MIDCQLCWRRLFRALLTSQSTRTSTALPALRQTVPRLRCLLSTTTSRTSAAQPEAATGGRRHTYIQPGIITPQDRLASRRPHNLQKPQPPSPRPPPPRPAPSRPPPEATNPPKSHSDPQSSFPTHLTVSEDPAKLAAQTKRLLDAADSNPSPEARLVPLTYVRAATSAGKTDTTAAWNELISHAMSTGNPVAAYKHYNDMKKRGVSPNSHTYTILISGLALPHNAKHPTSLPRALATYRALRSRERDSKGGKGKAEWNLIHTNAILKVCSRLGALEEMWQIVGELPEEGKNSADARTYTSLLNGLRQMRGPGGRPNWANAGMDLKDEPGDKWDPNKLDIAECQRIEEIVDDAERMWGGLLTRYANGRLAIDEELICAMARLRLSSTRSRDWHKVFAMMEELYGIPNFDIRDGKTPSIEAGKARWSPPGAPKAKTATLGVLLEAAEHLHTSPTVVQAYWDHFTQTLQAKPDLDNHHGYLRALRRSRDGQTAADLVEEMVQKAIKALDKPSTPSSGRTKPRDRALTKKNSTSWSEVYASLSPIPIQKTFTIALSCCKRLTTTGAATSTPKHSYMYPNAVRILNAFDSLYTKLSSLPPAQPGTATSPASYYYQVPASQAILSQETACSVYTKFLETAKTLAGQDPQVAKQALKRATSGPEEKETNDGGKQPPPRRADAKPPALPPHLPTLLSSSTVPPPHATNLAEALLGLATHALQEPRAKWGHGERQALSENTGILRAVLDRTFPQPNTLEQGTWKGKSSRTAQPEAWQPDQGKSFASSRTAQPEAWNAQYLHTKQRGGVHSDEGVEDEGDSAAAWQPDSARDREKKRMDAWGIRAKVGAIGEAGRLKHHKPDYEEMREEARSGFRSEREEVRSDFRSGREARSDFRSERESGREGWGYNGHLRWEGSVRERGMDRRDRGGGRSVSEREGGYGDRFERERGGDRERRGDDRKPGWGQYGRYSDKPSLRDPPYTSRTELESAGERDGSRDWPLYTPPPDSTPSSGIRTTIKRVWDGSGAPPNERVRNPRSPPHSPPEGSHPGQVTDDMQDDALWQAYTAQQQQQTAKGLSQQNLRERGRGSWNRR